MADLSLAQALQTLVLLRDQTSHDSANAHLAFARFCLEHAARSHSQFLQDLWVAFETGSKRGGYFVEFGAADGVTASNSLFLERELGWTGVLAEPARIWGPSLKANRACQVDQRCVWRTSGERLAFVEPRIALHSTLEAFAESDNHAATRREGERYEVETVSLGDLLAERGAPPVIDYLSLDTEGSELEILAAFDFDRWDVRLITVEHNHAARRADIFDLLSARGFRRRFQALSAVDDWYVRY